MKSNGDTVCVKDLKVSDIIKFIKPDYYTGLNRKPILHLFIGMPVIFNLSHKEIYDIVYRIVKYQFKETHRLTEDKASRISNILACKCTKTVYKHREVVTDIAITVDISNGIKLEYSVLGTGV